MKLTIDFETRSAITNLPATGPWPYASHPSTDVWCLSLKIDDGPSALWSPAIERIRPGETMTAAYVVQAIANADEIEAHNVQFEQAIWYFIMHLRYGFPDLPEHKLRCSAAKAATCSLPRQLEKAIKALSLPIEKDMAGHKLMMKMSKPRAFRAAERKGVPPELLAAYDSADDKKLEVMCAFAAADWAKYGPHLLWHDDPADILRLGQYCMQDTDAEHCLSQALSDICDYELPIFQHDLLIQRRGVGVDVQMAQAAVNMIREYSDMLQAQVPEITGGAVQTTGQLAAVQSWLADQGVYLDNMQADTIVEALEQDLPDNARRLLEIRQAGSKSSTSKYEAAITMACYDSRIRGFGMYHGAGTGRWAGKGIQLHNLPRGIFDMDKAEDRVAFWHAVELVRFGDLQALLHEHPNPMPVLSSVIRPLLLAAPGYELVCADFRAIEGRCLAWLAGEQWVLEAYEAFDRGEGPDMYMVTAGKILGKPGTEVTKAERKNPGKIADLACGYFGGPGAIRKFNGQCPDADRPRVIYELMRASVEDVKVQRQLDDYIDQGLTEDRLRELAAFNWAVPDEEQIFFHWAKDIVAKWRDSRPATKQLWFGLESAAVEAVETGEPRTYGKITYAMQGQFLTCRLPSGRLLYYPFPKLAQQRMPWGSVKTQLSHRTVDSTTKQWVRRFAHGGVLTENVVQAISRDILAEALLRLERAGFPIVLHVHDEAVAEQPRGSRSLDEFIKIMSIRPSWAQDFPIAAAGWVGERYRKD